MLLASPASAAGEEKIDSYDVQMSVGTNGVLVVLETIQYDFGSTPHHGIYRTIPVRYPYDDTYERVLKVSDIHVQSDAPDDVETSNEGDYLVLRIGDEDKTVTGKHTYTISYSVRGALNAFSDHVELSWNAIGVDWPVPISDIQVSVQMPGDVTGTTCFAGSVYSQLPCDSQTTDGRDSDVHPGAAPGLRGAHRGRGRAPVVGQRRARRPRSSTSGSRSPARSR